MISRVSGRFRRKKRVRRRRTGRVPEPKRRETPRRGQRPRQGLVRYWLRRPEPSVAVAASFTLIFLLTTAVTRDWALLFIVLPCAGAGLFVWVSRDVWRRNADRWRQGYDDVF